METKSSKFSFQLKVGPYQAPKAGNPVCRYVEETAIHKTVEDVHGEAEDIMQTILKRKSEETVGFAKEMEKAGEGDEECGEEAEEPSSPSAIFIFQIQLESRKCEKQLPKSDDWL